MLILSTCFDYLVVYLSILYYGYYALQPLKWNGMCHEILCKKCVRVVVIDNVDTRIFEL